MNYTIKYSTGGVKDPTDGNNPKKKNNLLIYN
jgi:hypothetical protein